MAKKRVYRGHTWIYFEEERESFAWRIRFPNSFFIQSNPSHRFVSYVECKASMIRAIEKLKIDVHMPHDTSEEWAKQRANEYYEEKLRKRRDAEAAATVQSKLDSLTVYK